MKKKLLLIALPALMVLAGCSNHPVKPVEEKEDLSGMMLEDTAAHEDLFGSIDLNVRKLGDPEGDPAGADPSWTKMPKIGVQFSGLYLGDVRDGEGNPTGAKTNCFAVRYVAAISGLEDGDITAEWTRGVSDKTSTQVKAVSGGHYSTVEYSSLKQEDSTISASSEGTGYTKYIVYSMYDIPEAQADSFIVAYLTLSKAGETSVRSKAVAARIGGDHAFSFAANKSGGYFLAGTISGTPNTIVDLGSGTGTNKAQLMDRALSKNDLFGYYLIANENDGYLSSFQYYGWETFKDNQYYLERDAGSELFKVRLGGTYDIYVNESFKLWVECDSVENITLYLKPSSNWFEESTTNFAVWYANGENQWANNGAFLPEYSAGVYKLENYNFIDHPKIIFTRHNTTALSPSWDSGNKWSQTGDIVYTSNGSNNPLKSMCTITGWDVLSWDFVS